jgi:transposase-like protein
LTRDDYPWLFEPYGDIEVMRKSLARAAPTRSLGNGEIKRRTRAVGAFPDRASALQLVTAVAFQVTAIWTDRHSMDMSLLKSKEVVAKAA